MKKKVLIIANDNLGIGGIQNVIISIIRNLNKDYQFDVVVFDHEHIEYEEEVACQGKIFTIPLITDCSAFRKRADFYLRPFYIYRSIKKIIKLNGPYVAIHCHKYFESALGIMAAKNCFVPVRIVHSHSYMPTARHQIARRVYEGVYRSIIIKFGTHNLACSSLAAEYLFGKNNQAIIMPNAIDVSKFQNNYYSNKNPWSFLQVGRWGGPKNQLFSIEVFSFIYKQYPEAELTLVGSGESQEKAKLDSLIDQLKLHEAVKFLPAASDVPKLMAQNNILLFPSLFEGLGIVSIEAQASGMRCFASTNVPREADLGNIEFIDLEAGADQWAARIIDFIKSNGFYRKKVDMKNYDITYVINEYKKIYGGEFK